MVRASELPDINVKNDEVRVYRDGDGGWRWRRVDKANGRIVSRDASGGYNDETYATAAAAAYNVGCPVVVLEDDG